MKLAAACVESGTPFFSRYSSTFFCRYCGSATQSAGSPATPISLCVSRCTILSRSCWKTMIERPAFWSAAIIV